MAQSGFLLTAELVLICARSCALVHGVSRAYDYGYGMHEPFNGIGKDPRVKRPEFDVSHAALGFAIGTLSGPFVLPCRIVQNLYHRATSE